MGYVSCPMEGWEGRVTAVHRLESEPGGQRSRLSGDYEHFWEVYGHCSVVDAEVTSS